MKAVAYSIRPFEKEFLAKANQKKHDITLISNGLNIDTAGYAEGKDAVIIFTDDDVSAPVIGELARLGITNMVTCSNNANHIDKALAARYDIKTCNVKSYPPWSYISSKTLQDVAGQIIKNLDLWQQNKVQAQLIKLNRYETPGR